MSYDYIVMKLKRPVADPAELGPETVAPFGDVLTLRQEIGAVLSDVKWDNLGGHFDTQQGWMEFSVREGESDIQGFMVRTSHRSDHGWEAAGVRRHVN